MDPLIQIQALKIIVALVIGYFCYRRFNQQTVVVEQSSNISSQPLYQGLPYSEPEQDSQNQPSKNENKMIEESISNALSIESEENDERSLEKDTTLKSETNPQRSKQIKKRRSLRIRNMKKQYERRIQRPRKAKPFSKFKCECQCKCQVNCQCQGECQQSNLVLRPRK